MAPQDWPKLPSMLTTPDPSKLTALGIVPPPAPVASPTALPPPQKATSPWSPERINKILDLEEKGGLPPAVADMVRIERELGALPPPRIPIGRGKGEVASPTEGVERARIFTETGTYPQPALPASLPGFRAPTGGVTPATQPAFATARPTLPEMTLGSPAVDPRTILTTGGEIAGGLAGMRAGGPVGRMAGSSAGAVVGGAAYDAASRLLGGHGPAPGQYAWSDALFGAIPEAPAAGRQVVRSFLGKKKMSEAGEQIAQTFGDRAVAHLYTKSTQLDLMRTMAGVGLLGSGRVADAERALAKEAVDRLKQKVVASDLLGHPTPASRAGLFAKRDALSEAGVVIQDAMSKIYKDNHTTVSKAYDDFFDQVVSVVVDPRQAPVSMPLREVKAVVRREVRNDAGEVIGHSYDMTGPSIHDIHFGQAEAGQQAARQVQTYGVVTGANRMGIHDALATRDAKRKAIADIVNSQPNLSGMLNEYTELGANYKAVEDAYNNPWQQYLRGEIFGETLADTLLSATSIPSARTSLTARSTSLKEEAQHFMDNLPDQSARDLVSTLVLTRLLNKSTQEVGNVGMIAATMSDPVLNARAALASLAKNLSGGANDVLLGSYAKDTHEILGALGQAQRRVFEDFGRMFMTLKQPAMIQQVIRGAGIFSLGGAGWEQYQGESGPSTAIAATYLSLPLIFNLLLTNKHAKSYFIKGLTAKKPSVSRQAITALGQIIKQSTRVALNAAQTSRTEAWAPPEPPPTNVREPEPTALLPAPPAAPAPPLPAPPRRQ